MHDPLWQKGETKTAPKTSGTSQEKTCFLVEPKAEGRIITISTVATVTVTKMTALKE